MKERRDEQEARELLMAEVSIYTDDCGEIQFHCLNDCFIVVQLSRQKSKLFIMN